MYAGASILDATSSIETVVFDLETRWSRLCGDSANQEDSFSAAWGGIASSDLAATTWVQAGYENRAYTDTLGIQQFQKVAYVELSPHPQEGNGVLRIPITGFMESGRCVFPVDGEVLSYVVAVSDPLDVWSVIISSGSSPLDTVIVGGDLEHFNPSGLKIASWLGEVTHWENDMPGEPFDSCTFSNCMYANRGDSYFTDAYFQSGHVVSTDSSQWGVAIHDEYHLRNDFEIWDKIPQERAR
jgi:hypothetical protein